MPRKTSVKRELRQVSDAFRSLASAFLSLGSALAAAESRNGARLDGTRKRRKPHFSLTQRSALKLQGAYMGTMRGLRPRQRSHVKRIRAAKGISAAITAARRMAG